MKFSHRTNSFLKIIISLLTKSTVILSSVILVLLIIEITLRLKHPKLNLFNILPLMYSPTYQLDKSLIYSRKPNISSIYSTSEYKEKIVTNNLGWRDNKIDEKDSKTIRIITVGDSFTFGHGIESNDLTYPKLLENFLRHRDLKGKSIEVFNAAEKGYSPDQEYRQIKEKILLYKPDIILWNFSNPGDLYDLTYNNNWPLPSLYNFNNNKLIPLDARFNWLYITYYLKMHLPKFIGNSYLFNFGGRALAQTFLFQRKPHLSEKEAIRWGINKMFLEVKDIKNLEEIKGFKLIVVILPFKIAFTSNGPFIEAFNIFEEYLTKENIPVIDIKKEIDGKNLNDFLSEKEKLTEDNKNPVKNLYFINDAHPNRKGAEVIAKVVENVLTSEPQLETFLKRK